MSNDARVIGRWYIGNTLGKGGYSWVKKGKDIKTKKTVALKFMEKADKSWIKEQAEQVETEISALKNIRHKNVMKLYAYNLNAQYPTTKKGEFIETILLVLEYAPGGELFDILYYTGKLPVNIARSYFHQILAGLDACHKANVVHRDLKPQNLLLDHKYTLKITDFGLSKVIKNKDDKMKTTYVGTRGYQAPELLLKHKYTLKCDIFSTGVILFILLSGYPPFEEASKNDRWFKPLITENYEQFWKSHKKSPISSDPDGRDLIQRMLAFDPSKRISTEEIRKHKWFTQETLKQGDLIKAIQEYHRRAEQKRRADVKKQKDLAVSLNPNRDIKELSQITLDTYTKDVRITGAVRTYGDENSWKDIYNFIEQQIAKTEGVVKFNVEDKKLEITMAVNKKGEIKFSICVYYDKSFGDRPDEAAGLEKNSHIYVVEAQYISGDYVTFVSIKKQYLMFKWAGFIKGLPKWAQKIQEKRNKELSEESKESEDMNDEVDDTEYDTICQGIFNENNHTKFIQLVSQDNKAIK